MLANSGEPDQMSRSVASDLVLRCLPLSYKKDARLIWANTSYVFGRRQYQLLTCIIYICTSYNYKWASYVVKLNKIFLFEF